MGWGWGGPLGYSVLGGFTISDQLDEKSGFRPRGGGKRTAAPGSKAITKSRYEPRRKNDLRKESSNHQ